MNQISSGLLMVLGAGLLIVLWSHGYFADQITAATSRVVDPAAPRVDIKPKVPTSAGTVPGNGIPLLPVIQPINPLIGTIA